MAERPNIIEGPFDGQAAWAALPPHARDRIGAFALELGVALGLMDYAEGPAQRAGEAAFNVASDLLREAVLGYDGIPDAAWVELPVAAAPWYRVPSCVGMVCRTCGCSHNDPCDEGCGWHADGLCTACAGKEPDAGVEAAALVFPAQTFTLTPLPEGWIGREGKIVRDEAIPEEASDV